MMCTCCAAPIASGLRKRNVSVGAALAFWLGNPLLNPATLIFMAFVLSWKFMLMRIVFGILLTFGVSYFANRFAGEAKVPESMAALPEDKGDQAPFLVRWLKSLGMMLVSVVPAYLIAVLLLGAFQSTMFPVWVGGGIAAVIVFAVVGTLFVIPTAAEIPIIQSFLALGMGTGPAAALLVTLLSHQSAVGADRMEGFSEKSAGLRLRVGRGCRHRQRFDRRLDPVIRKRHPIRTYKRTFDGGSFCF